MCAPADVLAWGAKTHALINRRAVQELPSPARDAWLPFAAALEQHANDADNRKSSDRDEPPRHFVDADRLPPRETLPRTLRALRAQVGHGDWPRFGVAPWAVDECYRMVVLSLRRGNWGSAAAWAADLGHYVADTHQPLHCTSNYDGFKTGNAGVHARFEVHMMDQYFDESALPPASALPALHVDVLSACFAWVDRAAAEVDPLLSADTDARTSDPRYGSAYYEALWEGTRALATRQVELSIRDTAMLLQAAWVEAGAPAAPAHPPALRRLPARLLEGPAERSNGTPGGPPLEALGLFAAVLAGLLVIWRI